MHVVLYKASIWYHVVTINVALNFAATMINHITWDTNMSEAF